MLADLPERIRDTVSALHLLVLDHGCQCKVEAGATEGSYRIVYSAMNLAVHMDGERVTLSTDYDIRAFLDFYRADADIAVFYDLEANLEKGSCTFAFRYEMHNGLEYFVKPIIKGAEVVDFTAVPDGMEAFTLAGGKYARLTETLPNGELDWWAPYYALRDLEKDSGYQPDLSRLFFVRQTGCGRECALYVPVR